VDAVLDTNVVVSALISPRGAPAEIFRAWHVGRFAYITSPPLLDELARVLSYPRIRRRLGWTDQDRAELLEAVAYAAKLVVPDVRLELIADDPDDNRVLEAALASEAAYIVSGDRHLLELVSYEGAEIVTPARFAALLSIDAL
jgi:putative PIN family toxin of toxin-antitoxin system